MAQAVETTSGGKSSVISCLSCPCDTTILAASSTVSAATGDQERTVIRPQLWERFWTSSVPQTSFGKGTALGTLDCAPNRMTLCSLLHPSLFLSQSKQAAQATPTQQSPSPVVPLQTVYRKQRCSFQEPPATAHMCRFQAKERRGADAERASTTSVRKFKLRAAPVDFGAGTFACESVNSRVASHFSGHAVRSRMAGIALTSSRGRNAGADPRKSIVSLRNHCLNQAFPASAEPAPLRLILSKSQQNQQVSIRRCSFAGRRNGRHEFTSRLRSSQMQYGHDGGDAAPPTAQTAHRKGSQRGLGLKNGLSTQHKLQECLKVTDSAAESRLANGGCMANRHSGSNKATPQRLEKPNLRCLLRAAKTTVAQANAAANGQIPSAGNGSRLGVQKYKGTTPATANHSAVAATVSAETDFHSPLVAECSSQAKSFLNCASHVPCTLGATPSSSPLRNRQRKMERKPLKTPPASIVQEKVEAGGHCERETATTAAATPPTNQGGVPATAERVSKTEAHPGRSTSAQSTKSELDLVECSQHCLELPPGIVGEACQNRGKHTSENEGAEENAEEFAVLRHSEVSFVCVRALVSFLATCCTISHFGSDERLQQINDLSTSPFHCSSRPQIGLGEYLVKRIFRHGKQSINEGVMAVGLLSRFLCKQNTLLVAALRENSQQKRQQQHVDNCNGLSTAHDKETWRGSVLSSAASATEGFAATAARIGYIEFNYLTAHRLLLTAAFLARKTHKDDHTSIRHWAQVRGNKYKCRMNLRRVKNSYIACKTREGLAMGQVRPNRNVEPACAVALNVVYPADKAMQCMVNCTYLEWKKR